MKKITKTFLAPLPIVAVVPTIVLATSCNSIDYTKALEWYEAELTKAQATFKETSPDANLEKGLSNVAEIEKLFIQNKVNFYWLQTIVNLRQDRYNEEHEVSKELRDAWDAYYGSSGDERKLYEQYKVDHAAEWLNVGDTVKSCEKSFDFYQTLSVYNAFVANKGAVLKDLIGFGFHIINDADSRLLQEDPKYTDELFYADVDGACVGYIYSQMNTPYKSPTLALYKYYTEYDKNLDAKLALYRDKILNLKSSWTYEENLDDIYAHIFTKLSTNYYLLQYTQYYTNIKFDKESHLEYIGDAINVFIKKIFNK